MNIGPTRRHVIAGLAASSLILPASAQTVSARLLVVGGGFGGMIAARRLKSLLPSASVQLIEPRSVYHACPFSNLVVAGERPLSAQAFGYDVLGDEGVEHIRAAAVDVDPSAQTVSLDNGNTLQYDKLVLSPGVDIRWNALEGYDETVAEIMPHAWKAGTQTTLLKQQLAGMDDGGLVVMSVPAAPYRCPPGPYERASLIAHFLKTHKPKSRLIVLDSKDSFSKKPLFQEAWASHYPDHLEWRGLSNDGRVGRVIASEMTLETDFESFRAAVANVIPPQKAAMIAERAGVADRSGWCPVNALNFESTLQANIHVIGDANIVSPMPKSAFSANLQGKLCALQIARSLSGLSVEPTTLLNTCYSYTTPDEAISVVGVYRNKTDEFSSVPGAGGISPMDAGAEIRGQEALQAQDWFRAITGETFG